MWPSSRRWRSPCSSSFFGGLMAIVHGRLHRRPHGPRCPRRRPAPLPWKQTLQQARPRLQALRAQPSGRSSTSMPTSTAPPPGPSPSRAGLSADGRSPPASMQMARPATWFWSSWVGVRCRGRAPRRCWKAPARGQPRVSPGASRQFRFPRRRQTRNRMPRNPRRSNRPSQQPPATVQLHDGHPAQHPTDPRPQALTEIA